MARTNFLLEWGFRPSHLSFITAHYGQTAAVFTVCVGSFVFIRNAILWKCTVESVAAPLSVKKLRWIENTMISRVQTSRINKGIRVCEVLYLGTRYNLKVSALAQRKVESFGEALTRTPKLFTGQKQRLYQHSAVCPMRSFPMCPRRPRRGEAKQLVADGAEVCSHACFMKHNSPPASFSPLWPHGWCRLIIG